MYPNGLNLPGAGEKRFRVQTQTFPPPFPGATDSHGAEKEGWRPDEQDETQ
jgi:hypothetical protein